MVFLQAPPHPALQSYIAQYIYASFNTSMLPSLKQTFLPYDIPAISFFIGQVALDHGKTNLTVPEAAHGIQSSRAYYNALTTASNSVYFKKNEPVTAFIIIFKPAGFSALFRRDVAELTNQLPDFLLLAGASEGFYFLEQLAEAKSFAAQASVLDNFFLKKAKQCGSNGEQISEACRQLIVSKGLINIKELAYQTNMSLRTLERQFTERVGVSPKTFARFKRFHHALSLMNGQKQQSYTSIAYSCGYYDQSHFINEFKSFANHSPSEYVPAEYVLYNQIILFRNFSSF